MDIFFIRKKEFFKKRRKELTFFEDNGLKSEKRRLDRAASRFIINFACKNFYKTEAGEIITVNNKPLIKDSPLHFSVSHSNDIVAVLFDKDEVGFDIEIIKKRNIQSFSNYFKREFGSLNDFYEFWTKYEASIKLGTKVNKDLTFKFEDYMLSIAAKGEISPVCFYEIGEDLCLKKSESYFLFSHSL